MQVIAHGRSVAMHASRNFGGVATTFDYETLQDAAQLALSESPGFFGGQSLSQDSARFAPLEQLAAQSAESREVATKL